MKGNQKKMPTDGIIYKKINSLWESAYLHIFGLLLLSAIIFQNFIGALVGEWNSKAYATHCWLIPFIVFWLVWRNKDEIKLIDPTKKCSFILFYVISSLILFLIGEISLVFTLQKIGFILFLISSFVFIIGKETAKKLFFPIAYSIFMIPPPVTLYDYLTFPFKKLATYFAVYVISLFQIPVYREGNVIHLANTTLEVANACSGLNTLIAVLALGTLWAYIIINGNVKKLIFGFLLFPIAIFANTFRIVVTALIANFVTTDVTKGLLHEFTGTIFVMIIAFVLMIITTKIVK